jgi:hypothetical protein
MTVTHEEVVQLVDDLAALLVQIAPPDARRAANDIRKKIAAGEAESGPV